MALLEGQVYTYMCEEIIIIGLIICKKGSIGMTWYPPYVVSGTQGWLYWQKGLYPFACMYNKVRLCLKVNSKAI